MGKIVKWEWGWKSRGQWSKDSPSRKSMPDETSIAARWDGEFMGLIGNHRWSRKRGQHPQILWLEDKILSRTKQEARIRFGSNNWAIWNYRINLKGPFF